MTDYQIQASSRRCAATGREIRPGEAYYSALLDEGGAFVRRDYSDKRKRRRKKKRKRR